MAHVFRLKLQALYGSRLLSSPALASRVLDSMHISLKCYGGSALLEESSNSSLHNDTDGDSKVANVDGYSAKKCDKVEDKASKESNVDKLANSICDKLWAKANVAHGEKVSGFQGDSLSSQENQKTVKNEKWQQIMTNFRSVVDKTKTKAAADDKAGVQKTTISVDQQNFADLDLPEAGGELGISRGPDPLLIEDLKVWNSTKPKTRFSQFSHQQKSKASEEELSFLNSLDDTTPLRSLMSPEEDAFSSQTEIPKSKSALSITETDNNPQDLVFDVMPGSVKSKMSKGKDTTLPQAADGGSGAQIWNQRTEKDATPGMSNFKTKPRDGAPLAQLHGKFSSPQPSHHDNSIIPRTVYMVCVQNLPSSCNPAVIKSIMASYGEVLGLFKRAVRNECYNVYVEFKTEQSMEAALAARKLQIGSKSFLVVSTDKVFSTVVRLCKVNNDTTEKQLISTCEKYGTVDNIKKRVNGIYDVYYQVKELPNMTRILGRLNEVTFNGSAWVAAPAPVVHPSVQKDVLKSPDGQAWHNTQVHQALNRIESGMDSMSVLFEDLKELTALGKEFLKS